MPELMKAICPICGLEVNDLAIHIQADEDMLEIVKLRHPECQTPDGIDRPCLEKLRECTESGGSCGFFTGAHQPIRQSGRDPAQRGKK